MAFLGVKIVPEVARMFRNIDVPGKKEPENEYHITVLCFDSEWPLKNVAKAMQATYEVVQNIAPFHVKSKKVTCFPKREDNPVPIIAAIESDELHDLNKKLKKAFDKEKIDYMKTFKDFKPHMTLAFAQDEIKDIKIDPVEFYVHELVLWCGDDGDDRFFITFPLQPSKQKKQAYVVQFADIFYKLAQKDPNTILRTTSGAKL